ncbi:MAG TPA: M17 family peptidase N-terminal domain-containing protein, partial [Longimicrobium sp.]|nr:M17 family peptidase N-terminal domain-containing protein [Longimicrobium sp.]
MKISVSAAPPSGVPLLVVPVLDGEQDAAFRTLDQALGGQLSTLLARGDLKHGFGETTLLFPHTDAAGAERVLLVGLAKAADFTGERLRRAAGTAARQAGKSRVASLAFALPASSLPVADAARAVAEGLVLGGYDFRDMKSQAPGDPAPVALDEAVILLPAGADEGAAAEGARVGEIVGRAENLAR